MKKQLLLGVVMIINTLAIGQLLSAQHAIPSDNTPIYLVVSDLKANSVLAGSATTPLFTLVLDDDNGSRFSNPEQPDQTKPVYAFINEDVDANESGNSILYTCQTPNPGNTLTNGNNLCFGQSITLSLQNAIPGTGISYQWQVSSDGVNYSNITGADEEIYTTAPAMEGYYQCLVTCQNGPVTVASTAIEILFNSSVLTTTPDSRCGMGTLQLEATISNGTLNWYEEQSGGFPIATGSPFVTPTIDTTTTYYAAADLPATGTVLGSGAWNSYGYVSPFYHLYGGKKSQYLIKASELITSGMVAGDIHSLSFEVVNAGISYQSFNLSIGNTALTSLPSTLQTGLTCVYSAASILPATGVFTINFSTPFLWDGISNLIVETCWSNDNTGGASATVKYDPIPYTAHSYFCGNNQTSSVLCANTAVSGTLNSRPKMYFNYVPACLGARTPVVATVITPPVITVMSSPDTICANTLSLLTVTSLNPHYQYTWMPGNFSGASREVAPEITTNYIVSAIDSITGCSIIDSVLLEVELTPTPISIAPPVPNVMVGAVQQLVASGGQLPGTVFFSEEFNSQSNSWTTVNNSIAGANPAQADWTLRPDGYTYGWDSFHSNDNSQFFMSNSDAQGSGGSTHTELISPVLNTTGYETLSLSFWHYFLAVNNSMAKVEVSVDGGVTWETSPIVTFNSTYGNADEFVKATIDFSSFINQDNLKIRFVHEANYGWYWCIDNVSITGSAQDSLFWSPHTDLYTDEAATIPYSGESLRSVYTKPSANITYLVTAIAPSTGCPRYKSLTVNIIDSLKVTGTSNPNTGCQWPQCNGSITLTVTGGIAPYTYLWSTGSTLPNLTGLCSSYYTPYQVTVTDASNTSVTGSWYVDYEQWSVLDSVVKWSPSCINSCDGSIITFSSEDSLEYLWSGPLGFSATTSQIENLCNGGYYELIVTTANGCREYRSFLLFQPQEINLVEDYFEKASCPHSNDGYILQVVHLGNPPHTFLWSTGETQCYIDSLAVGHYSVTVTDVNGCTATNSWDLGFDSAVCTNITVNDTVTTAACYDALNTITVAGNDEVFEVTNGGNVTFIAGEKILFLPGTKVTASGYLHGYISPSGPFCSQNKMVEVALNGNNPSVFIENKQFTVYPNPTNGNFFLTQKCGNMFSPVKVEVFTMGGERLLTKSMTGTKYEFFFSDMPSGIYFVKIIADGYVETIKLLKVR